MTQRIKALGYMYVAFALVVLGAQLPVRQAACVSALHCAISFAKAPVWSMIWPVYFLHMLPPLLKGMIFLMGGIVGGCWLGWTLNRYESRAA